MCVSCVCVPRRHPCFAATCELHARSSRRERAPGDRGARSRRGAGGPLLSRPPRWRVGRREWPRSRERVYLCRGRDPLTCAGKSQGLRGVCAERRPSSPGAAPPRSVRVLTAGSQRRDFPTVLIRRAAPVQLCPHRELPELQLRPHAWISCFPTGHDALMTQRSIWTGTRS